MVQGTKDSLCGTGPIGSHALPPGSRRLFQAIASVPPQTTTSSPRSNGMLPCLPKQSRGDQPRHQESTPLLTWTNLPSPLEGTRGNPTRAPGRSTLPLANWGRNQGSPDPRVLFYLTGTRLLQGNLLSKFLLDFLLTPIALPNLGPCVSPICRPNPSGSPE